jgi:branched-chain amino acid transport system permease protein
MLVATFAIAFLLQSIAVLAFGQLGTVASSIGPLNQPWDIGGVLIRKIAIVSIAIAAVCLVLLQLLLTRTSIGLHMRAAAMDFRTSRMLGVRANRVVGGAVLISGLFAAVSAIMLTGRNPQVTPIFGLDDTIIVLAGVVLGGLTRPIAATLGGFTIGFASGILGGALPTNQSQYLPSFLFGAVIIVLLLRPSGLFTRGDVAMERL